MTSKLVLDSIFQSGSRDGPTRFGALDLVDFISMPDPDVALAVGDFDWGVPVSDIPIFPRLLRGSTYSNRYAPVLIRLNER